MVLAVVDEYFSSSCSLCCGVLSDILRLTLVLCTYAGVIRSGCSAYCRLLQCLHMCLPWIALFLLWYSHIF